MLRVSPRTIIELVHAFTFRTHSQIDQLAIEYGVHTILGDGGIEKKETRLIHHLVTHPDARGPRGGSLVHELLERVLQNRCQTSWGSSPSPAVEVPELVNALKQDGLVVIELTVRPMLPEVVPVAAAQDELTRLLEKHGWQVAQGHLTQAMAAHARGDWAAANAQLRAFFEELLDRIASGLSAGATDAIPTSHKRREWLATGSSPFLDPNLNEWEPGRQGGFVQGLWRRLHPQGSHPGLSDETDSTFRLHLMLIAAEHYMRRYDGRVQSP